MTFTRRQVFQVGAAAGLTRYLGKKKPEPEGQRGAANPPLGTERVWFWAGDATQETVEITAYVPDLVDAQVRLQIVDDADPNRLPESAQYAMHGFVKWRQVAGLKAGQSYSYKLLKGATGAEGYGSATGHFTSLQPIGQACTIHIAVGGCLHSNVPAGQYGSPNVFVDMMDWQDPTGTYVLDRVVNLGDFGYAKYPEGRETAPGSHKQHWADQLTGQPEELTRDILNNHCMDYIVSDHDSTGNKPSNPPNWHDDVTRANLAAWKAMVPARMVDTRENPRGRYRSDIEGNVRFIKLDTRNLDRTDVLVHGDGDPIPPWADSSTMLGEEQLGWLSREITDAASNDQFLCIFSDPGWYGWCEYDGVDDGIERSNSDKWIAYQAERKTIQEAITAAYQHHDTVNAMIVCSDSHALQYDGGGPRWGGLVSVVCGPFSNPTHALPGFWQPDSDPDNTYTDPYRWTYPNPNGQRWGSIMQMYQRIKFAEDDGHLLKVTIEPRDCTGGTGVAAHAPWENTYNLRHRQPLLAD